MKSNTKKLVTMAMLSAISIILVVAIHFPIFPAAPFLEYDPADISIFIGTLMYGPMAGIIMTVVVCFLQGTTVSSAAGIIGIMMHLFATGSFVLVLGGITRKNKSIKRTILGLSSGAVTMVVAMIIWNLIFTPIFMGTPIDAVKAMLVPVIIPFNLIKSVLNAILAFVFYNILKKVKILELNSCLK